MLIETILIFCRILKHKKKRKKNFGQRLQQIFKFLFVNKNLSWVTFCSFGEDHLSSLKFRFQI